MAILDWKDGDNTVKTRRIKFYSAGDWSCKDSLIEAEKILDSFDLQFEYADINDVLELYNIQLFFREGVYLCEWNMEKRTQYRSLTEQFSKVIGKFASQLCDDNIIEHVCKVINEYTDSFWDVFENYKVYKHISEQTFAKILKIKKEHISVILTHPKTVELYGLKIAELFKQNIGLTKLLLNWYWADRFSGIERRLMFFPKQLTIKDRLEIVSKFIEESVGTEYLDLIANSHNIKNELEIPDKIRLQARRKSEDWKQEYFKTHEGISYNTTVQFNEQQKETIEIKNEGGRCDISYGTQFIRENLDYPTLLNNIIYLFEYTDLFGRCQLVHKHYQLGILERTLGVHVKNEYYTGGAFEQRQAIADMQLMGYINILKQYDIDLENIITWFYKDYLQHEFNIQGFELHMPSKQSTYLEKCRTICAEIESILKQYKYFVENGIIDQDLISMNSTPISIKDIPSLNATKYIYSSESSEILRIMKSVFSDQSIIYSEDMRDNFYLTMRDKSCEKYEFEPQSELDWLIQHDILEVRGKYLVWKSSDMVTLLQDLFYNEVSPYILWKYKSITVTHEAFKRGWIRFGNSLLSEPEQDYFNYILNRKNFGNSLDLRNLYLHGTQGHDEKKHEHHYYKFLELLIVITIKINDDLCVYEENSENI